MLFELEKIPHPNIQVINPVFFLCLPCEHIHLGSSCFSFQNISNTTSFCSLKDIAFIPKQIRGIMSVIFISESH